MESAGIVASINSIRSEYGLAAEEAIVVFYAHIVRAYLAGKVGKKFMKQIDCLIESQIGTKSHFKALADSHPEMLEAHLHEYSGTESIDIVSSVYEKLINTELKKVLGRFYTPPTLVKHILDSVEFGVAAKDAKIVDLACGAGVFLSASVKRILEKTGNLGAKGLLEKIRNQIYGIDVDEFACSLTRLNLLVSTSPIWIRSVGKEKNLSISFNVFCMNALTLQSEENPLRTRKFDLVIGNPPYVEAKRLPKKDKLLCRRNFPNIAKGAFDIYVCFIDLGLQILNNGGYLGFVLPDKFLVANYAYSTRKKILDGHKIVEICDISNLGYFEGTDVYPILFTVKKEKPTGYSRVVCNIESKDDFEHDKYQFVNVEQDKYRVLGGTLPFYCFENGLDKEIFFQILERFNHRLGEFLQFRTTVSFHSKGMREQYVSETITGNNKFKYLGGKSHAHKNEIGAYKVEWVGYYINYDNATLGKLGNPLPPISIFKRTKIIFCQHAKRMLAYCDESGEWVTKDVFPIAFVKSREEGVKRTYYYTGLLNSDVFSFVYAIIWKGIQIGDGYFHFLPSFLSVIPVPDERRETVENVCKLVEEIQKPSKIGELAVEVNRIFYELYELSGEKTSRVIEYNRKYLESETAQTH